MLTSEKTVTVSVFCSAFTSCLRCSLAVLAAAFVLHPPPAYTFFLYSKLYLQSPLVLSFHNPIDYLPAKTEATDPCRIKSTKTA